MTTKSLVLPSKMIVHERKENWMMTEMIENHNDALRKRKILIRQGSKYKEGLLVGADKEIEITEWFSGDHKGPTANEIDDRKGLNVLAITDKSKPCSGSNVVEKSKNREFDGQDKGSNKPKQSSYVRVLMVFAILLIISVGWKWIHLYQNAIAKREANVSRLFDKCHKRSWYSTLTGILFWEDEATKCKEYFLAMYANPMFEVNPMDAFIEVVSMIVLRPFQLLGESLGIFYKSFLEQLSFFWKIPGTIILLISFIFILVFIFGLYKK